MNKPFPSVTGPTWTGLARVLASRAPTRCFLSGLCPIESGAQFPAARRRFGHVSGANPRRMSGDTLRDPRADERLTCGGGAAAYVKLRPPPHRVPLYDGLRASLSRRLLWRSAGPTSVNEPSATVSGGRRLGRVAEQPPQETCSGRRASSGARAPVGKEDCRSSALGLTRSHLTYRRSV